MNHKGFVRELEKTYQSMWENFMKKITCKMTILHSWY